MRNSKKNNAEISRDIDQIYKGWLDKIGLIVASNERCTDDWEHWFEWKTYFEQGLSPMDAYRKTTPIWAQVTFMQKDSPIR